MIAQLIAQIAADALGNPGELTFKSAVVAAIIVLYRDTRKCWEDRLQQRRDIEELKRRKH